VLVDEDRIAVRIDHHEARRPCVALVGLVRELEPLRPEVAAATESAVRGLCKHDEEIDQRPGGERGDEGEEKQLHRFVAFVLGLHLRGHPAEGAAERCVRLRLEEIVGRREGTTALCSPVVPGELVFDD
jgi:hypothetical protein